MKAVFLALALLFMPLDLGAETADVTSGEHADFTRIVVSLDQERAWRFGRGSDGYLLTIDSENTEYDLSKVFNRIPKSRILDIKQVDGTSDLRITLACPCYATAFAFRPSVLVVDIWNGQPPEKSEFEGPVASFHARQIEQEVSQDPIPIAGALNWAARSIEAPEMLNATEINTESSFQGSASFRETLTQQLASAASKGVVEIEISEEHISKPSSAEDIEMPIRIDTEISEAIRIIGNDADVAMIDNKCLPDDAVDLPSWSSLDVQIGSDLADIHQMLVSDADPLPSEILKTAAQRYLFLGFGAEAKQLLSLIVNPSQDDLALISIADVLEQNSQNNSSLSGMEGCGNAAALWSVLSRDSLRTAEPINSGAILRNFATLPVHLRKHLASALIERFLEQGDKQSAESVREILARGLEDAGLAIPVASARLDMAEGRVAPAVKSLEQAVSRPGQDEPAALIALVDFALESQERVSNELIKSLEALAAQLGGQPVAAGLNRALVIAYALEGEFQQASSYLSNATEADQPYWSILAQNGGDSDILEYSFLPPLREHTDPETVFKMANRLAKLGFSEQALSWLMLFEQDNVFTTPEWRLMRADQHLALRDARQALSVVAGMGAEADGVRANAMRQLDRMDEAVAILRRNPEAGDLLAIQRAERLWGDVAQATDGAWSTAAQLLASSTNEAIPSPITLQFANDAVTTALDSRAAVQDLLRVTELPKEGP